MKCYKNGKRAFLPGMSAKREQHVEQECAVVKRRKVRQLSELV
jgi:hypothetical protein